MDGNQIDLGNEEIWDDSMLIDSWNQALEEYKKYHSIRAKGGSLEDLENELNTSSNHQAQPVGDKTTSEPVDEEASLAHEATAQSNEGKPITFEDLPSDEQASAIPQAFPSQAILGSIRDEGLKKLLMSWYYAGYYTGLYEGQQQAQQQARQRQS